MGWTAPRTWNIGELVSKALLDTHVRDNLIYLKEKLDLSLILSNRVGGNASNWNTGGSTTYTITNPVIQLGVTTIGSITTAYNSWYMGSTTVTFPTAFSNYPMILASPINVVAFNLITIIPTNISSTGFTLQGMSNSSMGTQAVAWVAIGT